MDGLVQLWIRPGLSRRLGLFALTIHTLALVVALFLPLGWSYRLCLALLILASLVYSLRVHVWRNVPSAIREAHWSAEGKWILTLGSGKRIKARLLPSSYVHSGLVLLNFRIGHWYSRSLVLLPDSVDPGLLRQVRVRLRSKR